MSATATAAAGVPAVSGAGSVAAMLGSLIVVLALIFALAWIARRLQGMRRSAGGLQVIAAVPVGQKEKVVMLKLGDEHFLLGVGSGNVSLLHRYEQAPASLVMPVTSGEAPAFAARLREMMGKKS